MGRTMDAIVGHRIAAVSVHRLVSDVAGYLRQAPARTTMSVWGTFARAGAISYIGVVNSGTKSHGVHSSS
jgi:hypothetical protein